MKQTSVLIVLVCVFVTVIASLTLVSSAANCAKVADFTPTVFAYLPFVAKQPTPTPPPPCDLVVRNNTGGELCYEVYGTGIGQKCYPPGTHYYGTFPAGTHSWYVTAWCGSDSGITDYPSGGWVHEFRCTGSATLESAPLLLQTEE